MKCVSSPGLKSPRSELSISSGRSSRGADPLNRPDVTSPTYLPNIELSHVQNLKIYSGTLHATATYTTVNCLLSTTSEEVVRKAVDKFGITDKATEFQLAEVCTEENIVRGERRLGVEEKPLELQNKWNSEKSQNNFYLRRKVSNVTTSEWIHRNEDLSTIRDVLHRERDAPDDLCELSTLTEDNLLSSLTARFEKDIIYTYVNTILIAVNPFKDLPIYNVDLVLQYNNKRRNEMPPHIFAVANTALRDMLAKRQNQCMVISGESGSGKTETTRHIIHWLTTTQNKRSSTTGLAQSILGAGELLEAFGNAQTSRNKNSSRFGRFIQLEYRQDGSVHGAVIEKYLLEKSRITNISTKERSYHVFYYLLAGCPAALYEEMHLQPVSGFNYLNQSVVTVDGMDDREGFIKLQRSMNMVGISEELQRNIYKVLSAILHLGNITFKKQNNIRTSEECVVISNEAALHNVAKMLCVRADLLQAALTTRKSFARGEQFVTHYKMFDATATRDTLAKSLYTYLFDWLLSHVNRGLVADNRKSEHYLSIGLLDIFGFEDFKHGNRFEQFCINFANEQLQHFFDQHIFKLEQDEYTKEHIKWSMVGYKDNESCLELFKGKPVGLLHLLDEENNFPGGSDQSLLQKFNDNHSNHENYGITPFRENSFEIKHYAGNVQYKIDEFLEKNRGHMRADIVHVLKSSTSLFIKKLIGCDPVALARWGMLRNYISAVFACRNAIHAYTPEHSREHPVSYRQRNKSLDSDGNRSVRDRASAYMNDNTVIPELDAKLRRTSEGPTKLNQNKKDVYVPASQHRQARQAHKQQFRSTTRGRRQPRSTVVGQFMSSLTSLVNVLNSATPHFIRCIKSNHAGEPDLFDDTFVLRQLRYTGMLETIQIRKASYPVRYNKEEFCNQFRLIMRESKYRDIDKFFEWAGLDRKQYQIGTSKVFMREGPLQILNESQDRLILARVQLIQRHVRAWVCRTRYQKMRSAAILIQRTWREYSLRERNEAVNIIISSWKMYVDRRKFLRKKSAAICIQRKWRKYKNLTYSQKILSAKDDLFSDSCRVPPESTNLKDNLMRDIMSSLSSSFSFLDEEDTLNMGDAVSLKSSSCSTNRNSSSTNRSSNPLSSTPTTTPSPPVCPLSPRTDPITTRGRAFIIPPKIRDKLQELDQEMPDEISIQTVSDSSSSRGADFPDGAMISKPSKSSITYNWQDGPPSLVRGSPARTPYSRSQSVTDPPPIPLVRSSSGYTTSWHDVQTTSFKFMRCREEQDTNAHFSGRRNRKRRNVKSIKKDDNRISKSLENIDNLELGILLQPVKSESSSQSSGLPYLNHIFKSVVAPRGSVCNSCGKKLQARIFARAMQCQAQTCHKIFHRNCSGKSGQCMPTFEQPKRVLAANLGEIVMFDKFIDNKIKEMRQQGEKLVHEKGMSSVFISVLKEFQQFLTRTQGSLSANPDNDIFKLYREECTTLFEHCLTKVTTQHITDLKLTLEKKEAIKAMLDSILENFMYCKHEQSFKDDARKSMLTTTTVREQLTISRANKAGIIEHQGHRLAGTQYGVLMTCDQCKKRINILEKCRICQECKVVYHPKCYKASTTQCTGTATSTPSSQPKPFFGTKIQDLMASEGFTVNIPRNLDKMMLVLEQHSLYTLGLYRVNANQNQIKSLKNKLLVNSADLNIESIQPQTLAAMIKMFFRELPEPILTFGLYDDLMRSSRLEGCARTKALLDLVHKLPHTNFTIFERLVYHLAQVAQQESSNKMNAGSLAVIFAPNLLRPQKEPSAMQALEDVKHRTVVIQAIIEAKIKHLQVKLDVIKNLNEVEQTPSVEEEKTKIVVALTQMPQADEVILDLSNENLPSPAGSAPISQGVEPLRHPTKNRPKAEKRAPSRRHSTDTSSNANKLSGGSKSIADGVKKKNAKARNKQKTYHGPYNTNHL